jgi:hypothetical protein
LNTHYIILVRESTTVFNASTHVGNTLKELIHCSNKKCSMTKLYKSYKKICPNRPPPPNIASMSGVKTARSGGIYPRTLNISNLCITSIWGQRPVQYAE